MTMEREEVAAPAAPERSPLDEAYSFIRDYLDITEAQAVAITLIAAHTHGLALGAFVTTCRLLFTSPVPESGKTEGMKVAAMLSSNPQDASGTQYALRAELAAATNDPGSPRPTLFYDEISGVFGQSGLGGGNNPLANNLRKGYKTGATDSWSVGRVSQKINIFGAFYMTGLRTAVPADIRSRCVVINMMPGRPSLYFDVRTGESGASMLAAGLADYVKRHAAELSAFRARGIHPKLTNRRREVWEPLFAVASLGGQVWLNRCLGAFLELALNEADVAVLTPEQTVLRDALAVLNGGLAELSDRGQVLTCDLRDELRRTGTELYATMTDTMLSRTIRAAVGCEPDTDVVVGGRRARGYSADAIIAAAEVRLPAEAQNVEVPEETDLDAAETISDDSAGQGTRIVTTDGYTLDQPTPVYATAARPMTGAERVASHRARVAV